MIYPYILLFMYISFITGYKMSQVAKSKTIIDQKLKSLGLFKTEDAVAAGVSQPTISRLARDGHIVRLEHGYYHHKDTNIDHTTSEFVIACRRLGEEAIIGGLTALFYYGLIEQVPQQLWIMLPHVHKGKDPSYRIIHTKHDSKVGVNQLEAYRIVTIERAIIEAFRYASKIGYKTALTAARNALALGKTDEAKIYETAKALNLWKVMEKQWEILTTK